MGNIASTVLQAASAAETFLNAVPFASAIGNAVSSGDIEKEQNLALQQLQSEQKLQERQLAENNALEKERIAANAAAAEEERRTSLRRAAARQKASFGASGVGNAGGGSAQAVLLGMFEETEADKAANDRLDALKTQALDQDLSNQKSLNVLQRTQLREQQRLDRELARSETKRGFFF